MRFQALAQFAVAFTAFLLVTSAAPVAKSGASDSQGSSTVDRDPVIADLKTRVAADPGNSCLLNDLGIAFAKRSFHEEAIEAFHDSLGVLKDPTVYTNLGSVYLGTGKLGNAESAFKNAIKLDPNLALAWYNLGAVADLRHDYDTAVETFRRALELDPTLADPGKNPQVVNNHYMLAVKTALYQDTVGSLALPLRSSCGPGGAAQPASESMKPADQESGARVSPSAKKQGKPEKAAKHDKKEKAGEPPPES